MAEHLRLLGLSSVLEQIEQHFVHESLGEVRRVAQS